MNPNIAKVEDAADSRRQGHSCSHLPQALDNAGDAVASAFPKGKNMTILSCDIGIHLLLFP